MLKLSTLTTLLASCICAHAQPVISNMENHSVGTSIKYINCNYNNVSPGPAGANQTWNFMTLIKTDTVKQWIRPLTYTAASSQFSGATYIRQTLDANQEVKFAFLKSTASGTILMGYEDSVTTNISSYPNPMQIGFKPINYVTTYNDTFTSNSISFGSPVSGGGMLSVTADGYGTLRLPNATYNNVIRVKFVYTQKDSGSMGPSKFYVTNNAVIYRWYDNAHASPLMVWDSTYTGVSAPQNVQSVMYLHSETPVVSVPEIPALQAWAAFSNNKLCLNAELAPEKQYNISLMNLNGQTVYSTSFTGQANVQYFDIDRPVLPGMYLLAIGTRDDAALPVVIKLVKQ